jgi:hypothetical protein
MILGELYLPLFLRGNEKNIGGHQKKREILGNCWSNYLNMTVLREQVRYWRTVENALSTALS